MEVIGQSKSQVTHSVVITTIWIQTTKPSSKRPIQIDHEGLPAPLWLHLEQRTVERRSEINKSLSLREPLCFCLCSHSTERRVVAGSGPAELKN